MHIFFFVGNENETEKMGESAVFFFLSLCWKFQRGVLCFITLFMESEKRLINSTDIVNQHKKKQARQAQARGSEQHRRFIRYKV
jgi:hypothetical protein